MITRVKGTQDILDTTLRKYALDTARAHFQKYDFLEIIIPIIEKTELFKRAVGNETDIVGKEMYFVNSSHDHDDEICLRPELTAPIVRAFLNNGIQTVPWKVFTIGPAFRHERPQKGRLREFYQMSLESIGSASVASDALFISMLERLFHDTFRLESYALVINFLGCHADREVYKKELRAFLEKHVDTLCENCKVRKDNNILRTLDCKNPHDQELYRSAPKITDHLCNPCQTEWNDVQQYLTQLSVSFTHDARLVRGLDYYSKTIFEFVAIDVLGAQSTFCAGGRYDSLAMQIGASKDLPSMGAGIGVERLLLMLEPIKDTLPIITSPPLHLILPMGSEQFSLALLLADELQARGICMDALLEGGSMKSMMRKADSRNARSVIILGTAEQEGLFATVKDMRSGTETHIAQRELADFLLTLR